MTSLIAKLNVTFGSVFLIFLASCASTDVEESKFVSQDRIYQNYKVEIDENRQSSRASATFRFGGSTGTTLNLSDESSVSLNGAKLNGKQEMFSGMVYSKSNLQSSDNNYTFVFTDTENNTYTNTVAIQPLTFGKSPKVIDKSGSYKIYWDGSPLGPNEKIELTLKHGKDQFSTILWTSTMQGTNSIEIGSDKLKNANPGLGNLQLRRVVTPPLQEGTELSGKITGIYNSTVIPVTIEGPALQQTPAQKITVEDQPIAE